MTKSTLNYFIHIDDYRFEYFCYYDIIIANYYNNKISEARECWKLDFLIEKTFGNFENNELFKRRYIALKNARYYFDRHDYESVEFWLCQENKYRSKSLVNSLFSLVSKIVNSSSENSIFIHQNETKELTVISILSKKNTTPKNKTNKKIIICLIDLKNSMFLYSNSHTRKYAVFQRR